MLVSDFPISNRTKNSFIGAGYYSEEDFKDKFVEDLKSIDGIGAKGITEIRDYLKDKFNITFKHKPKPKKIENPKECGSLVKHLLGHKTYIAWPKEMLTAKALIAKYGYDVLSKVTPNYKASSLSFYLCEDGQKYIRKYLPTVVENVNDSSVQLVAEVGKEPEQIEEIELDPSIFAARPKSIKDFL